jgi:cell division initiation protein
MKITPQEIASQIFTVRVKGFDRDEVHAYLGSIAETLENEVLEKEQLKKELDLCKNQISRYENRELVLRDTLVSAQKFSKEIKANAEKEGELVVREAEVRGEEIVNQALQRQRELREEIRTLEFKRHEIEHDIINMLNSLKELIETYRREDKEFDKVEYLVQES